MTTRGLALLAWAWVGAAISANLQRFGLHASLGPIAGTDAETACAVLSNGSALDVIRSCLRAPALAADGFADWAATMRERYGPAGDGGISDLARWRATDAELACLRARAAARLRVRTLPVFADIDIACGGFIGRNHPYHGLSEPRVVRYCTREGARPRGPARFQPAWREAPVTNPGYMVDGYFHERLRCSPYALDARSGGEASASYVAFSPAAVRDAVGARPKRPFELATPGAEWLYVAAAFARAAELEPTANATGGERLFWVSGRDQGRLASRVAPARLRARHAVFAVSAMTRPGMTDNGGRADMDRASLFHPARDVAMPPHAHPALQASWWLDATRAPQPRAASGCQAFFAGRVGASLRVRQQVADAYARALPPCAEDALAAEAAAARAGGWALGGPWAALSGGRSRPPCALVRTSTVPAALYRAGMSACAFCLMPRGYAVWSPRLVEGLNAGCIPVIVADNYWLPFSCLFDWRAFAVLVAEADAARVPELLAAIPQEARARMRARLLEVRPFFNALDVSKAVRARRACPAHGVADMFELAMAEYAVKRGLA